MHLILNPLGRHMQQGVSSLLEIYRIGCNTKCDKEALCLNRSVIEPLSHILIFTVVECNTKFSIILLYLQQMFFVVT